MMSLTKNSRKKQKRKKNNLIKKSKPREKTRWKNTKKGKK